jgi:5'(3')-deoxyribonucleotidase
MQAKELIRATDNSKIYLDMDGVLADFFHEYAKLAGVPADKFGKHDYRSIPPAKADPTLDKMIGTDFFMRLPKFPTADSLVKLVLGYVKSYGICSSPLRGDFKNSEHWKREWIKKNLNPQPAEIIITGQKERHAVNPDGSPNILIDDRGTNIVAWRARGGIGIKYQADEDSLDVVARGLQHAFGK